MGGFVRDARAGATVDLLFVRHNGAPIAPTTSVTGVLPGDTLEMVARMTNDQALTAAFFSISYDLDLVDRVDIISAFQWGGLAVNKAATDFFAPFVALGGDTGTSIGSFNGFVTNVALPRTLPPGSYQMGTVTWLAKGAGDVSIASFLSGADDFGDAFFNNISSLVSLHSATAEVIPEPGTASLLGLGLVGILLMGRRSRS